MSDYGEEIIDRLNENSNLRNTSNAMNRVINNTIGEWLESYDNAGLFEQVFLTTSSEGYLDLHGARYGVYRKPTETDIEYYTRIIYESLGHLTANYLEDIYELSIYVNVVEAASGVIGRYNTDFANPVLLTSDNPYIPSDEGYFILIAGDTDSKYQALIEKIVLGGRIKWLTL